MAKATHLKMTKIKPPKDTREEFHMDMSKKNMKACHAK